MKSRDLERERIVKTVYLCATPEQFAGWKRAARLSPPPFPGYFCTDCTPSYQREMKEKGWCARPEIRFKKTKEGDIEGYLPPKHVHVGANVIKVVNTDPKAYDGRTELRRANDPFGPFPLQDHWKESADS